MVDLQQASDELWSFCIERYEYAGVKEYSLTWQDQYGGNVNAVFALLWAQFRPLGMRPLDPSTWQHLLTQTQQVLVDPIRQQRRAMQDKSSPYYAVLLQDELDAERRQQQHLLQYLMTLQESDPNMQSQAHFATYIDWHCSTQLSKSDFNAGVAHANALASLIMAKSNGSDA